MKSWFACLVGACALALPGVAAAARTKITIYTALESVSLSSYKAAIEKAVPEAEVVWVRDSTGVITARFLAERDAPKADLVMGIAATSLLTFEKAGLLEPYEPQGAAALKEIFRDKTAPYSWTGTGAYLAVACFNTTEGAKDKIPVPASWKDLLDPAYKNKIVMPHPSSSGTGYLLVAGWLQSMGEAAGWAFMDALHENVGAYLHSGSAPCVQAARGERTLGLAIDMRGSIEKTRGAPIEIVIPQDGVGWEMEAAAIAKGSRNLAIARKVADWAASREANLLYAKTHAIVAAPGVDHALPNFPNNAEALLIKNDLDWMSENRERVLAEWARRYESKAAPKQ
jgi:iron(III) transport system substrate-binding protein